MNRDFYGSEIMFAAIWQPGVEHALMQRRIRSPPSIPRSAGKSFLREGGE